MLRWGLLRASAEFGNVTLGLRGTHSKIVTCYDGHFTATTQLGHVALRPFKTATALESAVGRTQEEAMYLSNGTYTRIAALLV